MIKREKITGDEVRLMLVEADAAERQAAISGRSVLSTQEKTQQRRDNKLRPFLPVIARQKVVVGTVREITRDRELTQVGNGPFRKTETIVVGRHDLTRLTPDHMSLIGLSFATFRPNEDDPDMMAWAVFAPFAVPTEQVEHFKNTPADLGDEVFSDVIAMRAVRTWLPAEVFYEAADPTDLRWKDHEQRLKALGHTVAKSERSLRVVTSAIKTPGLNPHLRPELLNFVYIDPQLPDFPIDTPGSTQQAE